MLKIRLNVSLKISSIMSNIQNMQRRYKSEQKSLLKREIPYHILTKTESPQPVIELNKKPKQTVCEKTDKNRKRSKKYFEQFYDQSGSSDSNNEDEKAKTVKAKKKIKRKKDIFD